MTQNMNFPGSYQFDEDIKSFLEQLGNPPIKFGGYNHQEVRLCCVIPGHVEKNPSLSINRIKSVFKCYGCGHGGSLARFASLVGLAYEGKAQTYISDTDPFAALLQNLVDFKRDRGLGEKPPLLRPIPPSWNWRGMDGKFLDKIGAKLWFDEKCGVDRVWMPAYQQKEMIGWFARVKSDEEYEPHRQKVQKLSEDIEKIAHYIRQRRRKGKRDSKFYAAKEFRKRLLENRAKAEIALDTIPKYWNNPALKAKQVLFPWDFVRKYFSKSKSIVLVEGQIDALSLIYRGIPAVAILGTNNFSSYKESMIVAAGFRRVIIAMDGDESGRKARKVIKEQLISKIGEVLVFKCPEGKDPATLPEADYLELRQKAGVFNP